MNKLSALAVALTLMASGCTLTPSYQRPEAALPATYPGSPAQLAGQAAAASVSWQAYFTDARLQVLIGMALRNNRDLRVAALNIEQARATFQVQRAALLPAVSATAAGSRSEPSLLRTGVAVSNSISLGISAWEIDLFGRIGSLKDAALAQFLATEEARKAVQISLIGAVANGWLNVLADDELLALTRQTLQTRQESVRLTKLRFDNGVSSEIDFQLANGLLESARATYAQQQRQRLLDENALALLLGQPLPAPAPSSVSITYDGSDKFTPRYERSGLGMAGFTPMPELPVGLPSDLLARRPDLRQAEQLLLAANANIGAARAAFFPRISLTSSIGSTSTELSGLFGSGSQAWSFAPQLTLPIFDGGRNQANLDASKVQRSIAVALYDKAVQTAFREVADALAGRDTLGEQLRATRAQADAAGVSFKLNELRYRNGIASALDLLDAQRSLFAAQQLAVQVRLLQLQNQVTLYKSLGGGWNE